jgi:hypothetical protein
LFGIFSFSNEKYKYYYI